MGKPQKKMTKEEKLAKDRLRKREKYALIKNDPELYSLHKEKEKKRYLARKERKNIVSIKDMTPRAQRDQRRRWRRNTQNYLQRKAEKNSFDKILVENTHLKNDSLININSKPSRSDPLMNAEVVPSTSSQNTFASLLKSDKRLRRIRYKYSSIVRKLNERIRKLEKEKDVLRKRRNITEKVCDTIEKKVNDLLIEIRPEKKEAVKRQLLFSETIKHDLQDSYKSLTKKDKRIFVDTVIKDDKLLRKYKLLQKLPFSRRQKKIAIDKKQILIKQIQNFFEEDTNSRFAADFSENYNLKFNEEIQSFHFGGSREQVSLHTGVLYYKDSEANSRTKSFCTISTCLKHDAGAVWAHLYPILKMAQRLVPYEIVHFLSDSPSSQYRNKKVFYLITKLRDINPNIIKVTWNYQETGHGKGAPDGIGAVVKRTADNFVKFGQDVGCYEDFWALVTKNIPNVHFDIVTESDIESKTFPSNIPTFKGSMQVHQVVWAADNNKTLAFRSLSCFECQGCIYCMHNKHMDFLHSKYYGDMEREQPCNQCDYNQSTCTNDSQSESSIDTSTILNNVVESDVLQNLHSLQGPIDLQLSPLINVDTSSSTPSSSKVKILSDVRLSDLAILLFVIALLIQNLL
ncbi:hypothetical protein ACJJTC_010343 [Scirpophaga incertulas]